MDVKSDSYSLVVLIVLVVGAKAFKIVPLLKIYSVADYHAIRFLSGF